MINLLSYVGMSLQNELCLWTLLGLIRTIFDATLFKVNSNLKQVWQMSMPPELSVPVQRALRVMISGVMLVQCFTVYVYLASYIVLLYPVFLEERPTLVLPWLLLAAVRKFLCELTSLALGLGACVLLGPARPPCIKFVVIKIASITPSFYMWMLVYSYYNALKVAAAFKTLPAMLPSSEHDYGLELAVRRRRTKSLQDEKQLRKRLVATTEYEPRHVTITQETLPSRLMPHISSHNIEPTDMKEEDIMKPDADILRPFSVSNLGTYEDWYSNEMPLPRDTDRILEQFVVMLLRLSAYMKMEGADPSKLFSTSSAIRIPFRGLHCAGLSGDDSEPPLQVGNSTARTASYLQEYPQIFMKKISESLQRLPEPTVGTIQNGCNQTVNDNLDTRKSYKQDFTTTDETSEELKSLQVKQTDSNNIPKKVGKKYMKTSYQDIMQNKYPAGPSIREVDNIDSLTENQSNSQIDKSENILLSPEVKKVRSSKKNKGDTENIDVKLGSVDSIQSIIDRMKNSLSQNTKSSKDDNKFMTSNPSSGPSTSRPRTGQNVSSRINANESKNRKKPGQRGPIDESKNRR